MAKMIDDVRKTLLDEVISSEELENLMEKHGFFPVETEEYLDKLCEDDSGVVKFTNYRSQIWVRGVIDTERNILIQDVSQVNRLETSPTRVEPFRSYEDIEKILKYFKDNGHLNHWVTAGLMLSLGRRVGDTVSLKWSDIFCKNGSYRERLTQLREEKTGKRLSPRLNALAKYYINEYITLEHINPMEHYQEKIVATSDAAFRKILKKAITFCDLNYPISTHSFRKWWANTIYTLHPQEADNLMIIQTMLGHSDINTTKIYIGQIDNKIDRYNEDYSNYMMSKLEGNTPEISNSPIVSLKSEVFRELLSKCWDMANEGKNKFDTINDLIGVVEKYML